MKRLIEDYLINWKNKKHRKPLMLQGARQVGKTYLLNLFGGNHFNRYHYFDLEEQKTDLEPIFNDSSLIPVDLLNKLSFVSGKSIDSKTDLLVFDEIQAVPRAITSLKYFHQQMADLAIATAGSNLGVASSEEPFPVGNVECVDMYPMNFEEFLLGTGMNMEYEFIKNFNGEEIIDTQHKRLFELLKIYFITGGLPEAILEYSNKKDRLLEALKNVRSLQKQLLIHYERDFSKYSGATNSRHIERVFNAIPQQLANTQEKNSKKFKFKDVISRGYRNYDSLADPIDWLVKAGLALKILTNEHPSIPLSAGTSESNFKLFLFDIGLLGAMTGLAPESIMRYDYGSYKGYFAENFVLQELYSYSFNDVVTWSGRTSEIEFVVDINGKIIPVEVKAGTNTKAKSLSAFINKYNPDYSVKISGKKYGYAAKDNIYNYPLYLISKLL